MKKLIPYLVSVLVGAAMTATLVAAQSDAAHFNIEFKAAGSVELRCDAGCAWKTLSWTCDEDDSSRSCEVTFDEFGMVAPEED